MPNYDLFDFKKYVSKQGVSAYDYRMGSFNKNKEFTVQIRTEE